MTARREAFLSSRTKCPACEAPRKALGTHPRKAKFECGAVFSLIAGEIACVRPCPARSLQAARHWNQQTEKG